MRRRIPGSGNKIIYRVRRGDSLWVISRRFGVSVNKLARWNGLSKRSVLHPGKRLVIWARHGTRQDRHSQSNHGRHRRRRARSRGRLSACGAAR